MGSIKVDYNVGFPDLSTEKKFNKFLEKVPAEYATKIAEAIRGLAQDPRPEGKKVRKLQGGITIFNFVAQYRLRVGPYRIFYDVDDPARRVILLTIARRTSTTY